MDHYQDIHVLEDAEISEHVLVAQVFQRLHLFLQKTVQGRVGISFPKVQKTLGNMIRLHGSSADLISLKGTGWDQGLRDYIRCSEINQIPEDVSWRYVRRVQVKSNTERLYRRSVRKGWITEEEAVNRIGSNSEQKSRLPYVSIKSVSNGNAYPLFIEHGPLQPTPTAGTFSSYGLSATTTIPWF